MIAVDPITAGFVLTRAVHFGACLLLLSVFIFDRLVMPGAGGAATLWKDRWARIARNVILLALPAALLSGAAWLVFVTASMSEISFPEAIRISALENVLKQSQFGSLWKFRSIAWLASTLTATVFIRVERPSLTKSFFSWAALLCSAAFAVSAARSGHGADGTRWHQSADAVHLLIGAAWPLGLVPLALLLFAAGRTGGLEKWIAVLPVIQRFSMMSVTSVLLMGTSGVINSVAPIGNFANLFTTLYGRTLLVKVALFVAMVILGAINTLYYRPRLAIDFHDSTELTRQISLRRLQRNIWIEIILAVGVLVAVGLLGTLSPACEQCCCAAASP